MKRRMKTNLYAAVCSALLLSILLSGCGGGTAADPGTNASPGGAGEQVTPPADPPAQEAGSDEGEARWVDGVYYAEAPEFDAHSGWKDIVGLKIEGGNITEVQWNALYKDGGIDKKRSSEMGKYGMAAGGAQAEWHEQAAKAEQYLIETQDPTAIVLNDEGKTDAVSGVSISVDGFVALVNEALAAGPVEPGPYKDGTYYAEESEFAENGWKYNATVTVLNGRIIAADWNGAYQDGGDDKDTQSADGTYGLVAKGGAQDEWHVQAARAEQYLIEIQDPAAITYTDEEGHTDAISGVSIHVVEFFTLAEQALAGAK